MALIEKLSYDDFVLSEILRNPVLAMEFIYNIDTVEGVDTPFEFTWYQKEILCDFNDKVSICTARATGKTVSLSSLIIWILICKIYPKDYILYTVPSKVHLEPVFTNLIRLFRSNSFLKNYIEPKGGINSSDYKITLLNGSVLLCRIAGQSGTGANLIGLHTPFIAVDEGGYFPWNAFQEMQPSLNVWTRGKREVVAGVPTGLRESNVLYHVDQENTSYTKHRVSAFDNPRITQQDIINALEQYGGEDSDDYIHYFLGQHGKPVFSLFDRNSFSISSYGVYQLKIDGISLNDNLAEIVTKINAFPSAPKNYNVVLGIDLGYTEPTAIFILLIDSNGVMKFHGKIKLTKVSYPLQEKLIDLLDTRFEPLIIGIDRGSAGVSVVQSLMESREYLHKNYKERIFPIDFSSTIVIGKDSSGAEIKSKTKPFLVTLLQDFTNSHRIIYSSTDLETVSELERMTYSKNPTTGEISYKTLTVGGGKRGEDHFTSALLCGVGAYYLTQEFSLNNKQKRKLMSAQWIT